MGKKNILITGICGLIGSRLAEWIINNIEEYQVIGIDNLFGGYIDNLNLKAILYIRDLAKDDIDDIFKEYEFEYVFHLAAYAPEGLSPFIRKFNYSNNMISTMNIINACINYNVKRLVYTSSMAVYGYGDYKSVFSEDMVPSPIDSYGISKYACELDIMSAGVQHDLDWCIIRPHNVYGINQNIWDLYRNVIGIWMHQAINNLPLTIYGDGQQTRIFSYADDMAPYIWQCAIQENCSKEIFNLGGIKPYKILDACNILKEVIGYDKVEFKEPRHEVRNAEPNPWKSIKILKYEDKTSLKEGISLMWDWAKIQPQREIFKWDKYEITKGLYEYWK